MRRKRKAVAVVASLLLGLGTAGIYASSMSVSATGGIGAGSAAEQASCATNVDIHPNGDPTWNTTEKTWVYTSLKVTGNFTGCTDSANRTYKVQGVVSDATGAALLNTSVYTLNPSDTSLVLTLTTGTWSKTYMPANIDNLSYGLIVRSLSS